MTINEIYDLILSQGKCLTNMYKTVQLICKKLVPALNNNTKMLSCRNIKFKEKRCQTMFALGCWTGFCITAPLWYELAMRICGLQ